MPTMKTGVLAFACRCVTEVVVVVGIALSASTSARLSPAA